MSEWLVLKGGTAINLCVFDLPRLSVDIDLDLSKNVSKEEMLIVREKITVLIGQYMASQGYSLHRRSKYTHSLDGMMYSYINAGGNLDVIKIEINYSLRSHIFPEVKSFLIDTIFEEPIEVITLNVIELFAAKINALLNRAAVRDLYDVSNMIDKVKFSQSELDLLRKSVIFYSMISSETINDCFTTNEMDKITFRQIKRDLFPVIGSKEHFDLEGKKLKVRKFIQNLMQLTDQEKQFIKLFQDKEYKIELLFDDLSIIERLKNHPMIVWKLFR